MSHISKVIRGSDLFLVIDPPVKSLWSLVRSGLVRVEVIRASTTFVGNGKISEVETRAIYKSMSVPTTELE